MIEFLSAIALAILGPFVALLVGMLFLAMLFGLLLLAALGMAVALWAIVEGMKWLMK